MENKDILRVDEQAMHKKVMQLTISLLAIDSIIGIFGTSTWIYIVMMINGWHIVDPLFNVFIVSFVIYLIGFITLFVIIRQISEYLANYSGKFTQIHGLLVSGLIIGVVSGLFFPILAFAGMIITIITIFLQKGTTIGESNEI